MPFVKEHLSSFIEDTESRKKRRSANTSGVSKSQDVSAEGCALKPPLTASPRIACKKAAELKSPVSHNLEFSPELDAPSLKKSPTGRLSDGYPFFNRMLGRWVGGRSGVTWGGGLDRQGSG
jgi:hypothetical protein